MRVIPPPIRSLELRDRLSELLGEALHSRERAAALYVLRTFGRLGPAQNRIKVQRDDLVEVATPVLQEIGLGDCGKKAVDELLDSGLLERAGGEAGACLLTPCAELLGELPGAMLRVESYCRALETLWKHPVRSEDEVARAMAQAAFLFNEGLFFEVHEVLEAVWLREEGQARPLLQGLIQIAVGFHHLENKNLRGALSLLTEGQEKARGCLPGYFGLDLGWFLGQTEACRRSIESLGREAFDRFDRQMIPHMRLRE